MTAVMAITALGLAMELGLGLGFEIEMVLELGMGIGYGVWGLRWDCCRGICDAVFLHKMQIQLSHCSFCRHDRRRRRRSRLVKVLLV